MTADLERAIDRFRDELADIDFGEVGLTVRLHEGQPVGFVHHRDEKTLASRQSGGRNNDRHR